MTKKFPAVKVNWRHNISLGRPGFSEMLEFSARVENVDGDMLVQETACEDALYPPLSAAFISALDDYLSGREAEVEAKELAKIRFAKEA
jgi:hypothetical protein